MVSSRAALLYGPGQAYRIETVEMDDPRDGEVLVEMRACGLCHSDEHARTGDMRLSHFPTICGHEGAGEIVAVGSDVTSVAPGDHVAFSSFRTAGSARCARPTGLSCATAARGFSVPG